MNKTKFDIFCHVETTFQKMMIVAVWYLKFHPNVESAYPEHSMKQILPDVIKDVEHLINDEIDKIDDLFFLYDAIENLPQQDEELERLSEKLYDAIDKVWVQC